MDAKSVGKILNRSNSANSLRLNQSDTLGYVYVPLQRSDSSISDITLDSAIDNFEYRTDANSVNHSLNYSSSDSSSGSLSYLDNISVNSRHLLEYDRYIARRNAANNSNANMNSADTFELSKNKQDKQGPDHASK